MVRPRIRCYITRASNLGERRNGHDIGPEPATTTYGTPRQPRGAEGSARLNGSIEGGRGKSCTRRTPEAQIHMSLANYDLTTEGPFDGPAIEAILDLSFGPERLAKTVYRLRDGLPPVDGLSFVARGADGLAGSIRFWAVEIRDSRPLPALLLGPLAVLPALRGIGIGRALVRHGLQQASAQGHGAVILVGDPEYYCPFGFERRLAEGLTLPGPVDLHRFLGLELTPGALDGIAGAVVRPGRCVRGLSTVTPLRSPRAARRTSARRAPAAARG